MATRRKRKVVRTPIVSKKEFKVEQSNQSDFNVLQNWCLQHSVACWIIAFSVALIAGKLVNSSRQLYDIPSSNMPTEMTREQGGLDEQERLQKMENLFTWVKENGGSFHKNLRAGPIHYEYYTTFGWYAGGEGIKKGEQLLEIPENLTIHSNNSLQEVLNNFDRLQSISSLGKNLSTRQLLDTLSVRPSDFVITDSDNYWEYQAILMGLHILLQRNNSESFFYPYFSSLPNGCQNSDCWSLAYSRSVMSTAYLREFKKGRAVYQEVAKKLGLPVQKFYEAISQVSSRCWGAGPESLELVLLPGMDIFNHDMHTDTMANINDSFAADIVAEDVFVDPGKEVFIHYSNFSSVDLLLHYGFILPENPSDTCAELYGYLKPSFIDSKIILPRGAKCYTNSWMGHVRRMCKMILDAFDPSNPSQYAGRYILIAFVLLWISLFLLLLYFVYSDCIYEQK